MPRISLYPFRYRSPVTAKWVNARYVTYCARHRNYAAMNGAAALLRAITRACC